MVDIEVIEGVDMGEFIADEMAAVDEDEKRHS